MLITRIIKTRECLVCDFWLPRLDKQNFPYELYDADAPENQKQLDEWKVDDCPVIQIVERTERGEVVRYQFPPGSYSVRAIKYKMAKLGEKNDC